MNFAFFVDSTLLMSNFAVSRDAVSVDVSPSPFTAPVYGQKQQMTNVNKIPPLKPDQTKLLQQVCCTFLYYARAIDCTMLHALNDLATRVADGTQETFEALQHFLNYCATLPETKIIYRASNNTPQPFGCSIPCRKRSQIKSRRLHILR